jgi:2-succinyl-6-hydroxy-2,4-cyclohexadiene-1-carboxylate synthase
MIRATRHVPRIRRLLVAGRAVEISDEGPPAAPAIVLLHGFTGSKDGWLSLRRALAARRRVVAVDLPGHGGTPASADRSADSLPDTAELIVRTLDSIDVRRFSLLGYSMGGRIALGLALDHPRRVQRLLVESASAGLRDARDRQARRRADEALAERLEQAGIEAFVREWEALALFASHARLDAALREEVRRRRHACSPAGLAASLRAAGAGVQPWLGDRLGELAIPVCVVVGALDEKFRAIGAWMTGRIAGARMEIVPGSGHTPHLERAEIYREIVERFFGAVDSAKEEARVDSMANGS